MSGLADNISTGSLTADDLADLMAGFNEVSAKLQATHETLRAEVRRLSGELRDANQALQRSKRLAALGEMAAGISHEVRNPLGSIKLYARMLEQDLAERPEQRDIACKIGSAVGRLNEVVGDVLTFSKDLRARPQSLDASDVLERAAESCRGLLDAEPTIRVEPGVVLAADAGLIEQALVNVVRNGAESMLEARGTTRGLELFAESRHDEIEDRLATVLSVRDLGGGVDPAVIERMFNPFFTTRETGTGLGLAIVHRIVDAHRGRVHVLSNSELSPGAPGTTVEFWIPQAPVVVASSAAAGDTLSVMERTA
ncbi:MAG: signal transduction histidine kinase [Phycisphaerales bacterium]